MHTYDRAPFPLSEVYIKQAFGDVSVPQDISTVSNRVIAQRFLVRFLDDSPTVLSRGADQVWPTASIAKLMSAVITTEHINSEHEVTLNDAMVATEGDSGLLSGESFTAADLLKAMLIASSNDAAESLAMDFGRSAFISLMNEKAREIGMTHTTFFDPAGLSSQNQSTPEDLVVLAAFVYASHPDLFAITTRPSVVISDHRFGREKNFRSTNVFTKAKIAPVDAHQIDFVGGKTGYTSAARGNLLSLISVDGRVLVIVVMGSQDRFGDTHRLLSQAIRGVP